MGLPARAMCRPSGRCPGRQQARRARGTALACWAAWASHGTPRTPWRAWRRGAGPTKPQCSHWLNEGCENLKMPDRFCEHRSALGAQSCRAPEAARELLSRMQDVEEISTALACLAQAVHGSLCLSIIESGCVAAQSRGCLLLPGGLELCRCRLPVHLQSSAGTWIAVTSLSSMPHCMAMQICACHPTGDWQNARRVGWDLDAAHTSCPCVHTCTCPTALPHPPHTSASARPSSHTPTRSSGCCSRCGPARLSWRLPGCGTVRGLEANMTVPWGDT